MYAIALHIVSMSIPCQCRIESWKRKRCDLAGPDSGLESPLISAANNYEYHKYIILLAIICKYEYEYKYLDFLDHDYEYEHDYMCKYNRVYNHQRV
jgi:hypothetical protein